MELQAEATDRLVGYNVANIVAVLVAQAERCEHGVSMLAPCEPRERVDMLAGYFVPFTVTEDERDG